MFWKKKKNEPKEATMTLELDADKMIDAVKKIQEQQKPKRYRAVINGKLYDTEKAEIIEKLYRTGTYVSNSGNIAFGTRPDKTIYRSTNGIFFYVLESSGKIDTLSESEIKEYYGEYNVDKYIELFGEPEEA